MRLIVLADQFIQFSPASLCEGLVPVGYDRLSWVMAEMLRRQR